MSDGTTTWNYTYNADGLRTERTSSANTYTYVYSGSLLAMMTVGENTLHFTYDASGVPLAVKYNGTTYYYKTNLQGDIIAILDSTGAAVVTYAYNAWGVLFDITGTMKDTLGTINPLTYRGYVYDRETELYYLQSRYYDPELGRFINTDVYISTGQRFVGNNMFAYCGNNPVLNIDTQGYRHCEATTIYDETASYREESCIWEMQARKRTKRKDSRKGSENRQPSGDRQRNIGHPNGEEHNRVAKGNRGNRGVRKILGWGGAAATTVLVIWLVANDGTGVGVLDDIGILPVVKLFIESLNFALK